MLIHKLQVGCTIRKFETGKHALKEKVPTADLDPKYKDSLNRVSTKTDSYTVCAIKTNQSKENDSRYKGLSKNYNTILESFCPHI